MPNADAMIRFYCVGCGRRNKAPRDYAGKNSRCPACKTINRIPETAGSSSPTPQFRARKTLSTPITPDGIVDAGASIIADVGDFMDEPRQQSRQESVQSFVDREAVQRRQKYETLVIQEEPPLARPISRGRGGSAQPSGQPRAEEQRGMDDSIRFEEPKSRISPDLIIALVGAIFLGALVTWFVISLTSGT